MLAVVAGLAAAQASATSATTVKVIAKDFVFELSTETVKPRRVMLVIRDASPALHDFGMGGHRAKTIGPVRPPA